MKLLRKLFTAVFLLSMLMIVLGLYNSHANEQKNLQLQEIMDRQDALTMDQEKVLEMETVRVPVIGVDDSKLELLKINKDTVGWLHIENTRMDYPVVLGDDNDYYLDHNFYGKKSKAGTVFMDYRNRTRRQHLILYGHNMRDGSMFKDLMKYKKEDFFRNNPTIQFDFLTEDVQWEVFSAYVTTADSGYVKTVFEDLEEYRAFLDEITQRSIHVSENPPDVDDQILTLSTCSYEFSDGRFVVHAKRKDPV